MVSKWIRFEVGAHGIEAFKEALFALAKGSKAEEGCVHYAAFQDSELATVFTVLEQWLDEDSFEAHRKGAPLAEFKAVAEKLIEGKSGQGLTAVA